MVAVSKTEVVISPTTSVSWRRSGMLVGEGSWKAQTVRCTFAIAFLLAVVVAVVVAAPVQPGQEIENGEQVRVPPCTVAKDTVR